MPRDRDAEGRARQARPRDRLGRPLPYGATGVEPVPEDPLPAADTLRLARRLLSEGRPFSAHEVLETRWKSGPDQERELWQGLAQLCVAVTHAERGNRTGAARLLERGRDNLLAAQAAGVPDHGIGVAELIAWAEDPGRALGTGSPRLPL